ncbi:MAG: hypothetical protein RTU63_00770 [Candidatus Thorarchaeota archaeon]
MSDEPVNIINEYLALVREKLPESIADDVVSELEMYMLETARDQGEDGLITFESAKKVVAQFGAPGEVADEYRFSMLPESIPEEDIPKEIVLEPITSAPEQQVRKDEPIIRKVGVDPTVTPSSFFFKSVFLTVMWAIIVTTLTNFLGPAWSTIGVLMISTQVFIVVTVLLIRYLDLKRKNVILWKRSFPDWSDLQRFVTLPENGLPSLGKKRIIFDIILSIIGLICCTLSIIGTHPIYVILIAIPGTILLVTRTLVNVRKMNDERDPFEMSRLEFGVNLSLLIIINGSVYWLFYIPFYYMFTGFFAFLMIPFTVIGGAVFLFEVLVDTQNLWWKTEKPEKSEEQKTIKLAVRKDMFRNGGILLVKLIGWIVIVDSIIIYTALIFAPGEMSNLYWSRITGIIGSVILGVSLVLVYCLIRYIRVRNFDSTTFIGRRTRLEALIDSIISIFLIASISIIALGSLSTSIPGFTIIHFYHDIFQDFNINIGGVIVGMDFLVLLPLIIALIIRIQGNTLEFKSEMKIEAATKLQKSAKFVLITLPLIAGGELVHYLGNIPAYASFIMVPTFYFLFMVVTIFVAFQVISSELKIKELTDIQKSVIEEKVKQVTGNNNHSTSIAN